MHQQELTNAGGNRKPASLKAQRSISMKTTSTISRLLLGLVFTVFGLNGFLNFFSPGPVPPLAGQFLGALVQSHYIAVVLVVEIVGGVALLLNRMTPFALTLLGPVIVNILLFHITMDPAGLPPAVIVTILWSIVFYRVRAAFAGLFQDGPAERSTSRKSAEGLPHLA
jgi:putative oxidoreductase